MQNRLGDCALALTPETLEGCFEHSIDKAIYAKEGITIDINELGKMGKFWKFIPGVTYHSPDYENDRFTIKADERKTDKQSLVLIFPGIESADVTFKNGKKAKVNFVKSIFKGTMVGYIDFEWSNPAVSFTLNYVYGVEPSCTFNLVCEAPVAEQAPAAKPIDVMVRTGQNLINVMFKPYDGSYACTKVQLFADGYMVEEKTSVAGRNMISFDSLAYGKYQLVVTQNDNGGNQIGLEFKTEVWLKPAPVGGKPTIVD